jgi:hypothetical protein
MSGGKEVRKVSHELFCVLSVFSSLEAHSFCRKLLNFGVKGDMGWGIFDNFCFRNQQNVLVPKSLGEGPVWYWSGGAAAWSERIYQLSAPPCDKVNCVYLTHKNIEQSNILLYVPLMDRTYKWDLCIY